MKTGGIGGANTKTGLHFEKRVDFLQVLDAVPGYEIKENGEIFFKDKLVAINLRKGSLYKYLEQKDINYEEILSKKLLPDDAILVLQTNTFYVIEIKFQRVGGSVDEKLQTSLFKKLQYEKLLKSLGIRVEYIYILNDWFKAPAYRDVLEYIKEVHCDYVFNEITLDRLGLPSAE